MKTLATLIALCIGFILPLQSSAFAQKSIPVGGRQKHTLLQNPLVNELTKQSLQRSNGWAPPYRPGTIPEANATRIVKSWEQDSARDTHAPAGIDVFGNDMSVFMLERNRTNTGFIASSDIPSVKGKISTKGAIWVISSQDPLTGKKVTSLALSGAVWTPRTVAVKKLNLAGTDRITTSPDFSFDAFKNSPGVIPFANGYAVNLFGQKLRQDGVLDTNPSLRGNYIADDGRPLYGRLIRVRPAVPGTPAAIEEIILAPAAAAAAAPAAVQPHPNDSEVFFRQGAADDDKGQYDRAIEEYTHAIRLNPNYAAAFYNRGLDYDDEGQYDRAIADYDQATRLSPNDPDVFVIRGLAYAHKGQYDRAIQDYNQAIKLKASDALAFYDRGLAYEKDRQYDRAVQDFDQAIRFNANDADAFLGRARAKQGKGDLAGANADSAMARQLNPALPPLKPMAAATTAPSPTQQKVAASGLASTTTKAPATATPPKAFSMFVPITKPGQKEPSIARVTAGKLDSVAANTIKLKSESGATSVFSTDARTIFCIHGLKAHSIRDIGALNGQVVSAYTDPGAQPNDVGQTYAFRIEDGGPEMTINLGPKAADGTNGTFSFPEKPCQDAAQPNGASTKP